MNKYPCISCRKPVKSNQNAILCVSCDKWAHLSCSSASNELFLSENDWICNICLLNELPNDLDISVTESYTTPPNLPKYNQPDVIFEQAKISGCLNIAHLNVSSLLKNIDEIRHLMNNNKIHILGLSETRLDDSVLDNEIRIDDYNIIRLDRKRTGGGIILYVHESVQFVTHHDFAVANLELLCIEILIPKQKPFMLVYWYRPPDSSRDILDKFQSLIEQVDSRSLDYVLMGDFNCDLLKTPPSSQTNHLNHIVEDFDLKQFVSKPTRVTPSTATLIDVLFSSNHDKVRFCDVVPISLSDHYMVIATWGKSRPPPANHKYIVSRDLKKIDMNKLKEDLSKVSWDDVLSESDVDNAYQNFETKFNNVLNDHAPIRKKRVRNKETPWMNRSIMQKMRERDKMKKQAKSSGCETQWKQYRKLRNQVTAMIRAAKRSYISESIVRNRGDSAAMWKSLRYIIPSKKKSTSINKLVFSGNDIVGYKNIASSLNEFFVNVSSRRKGNVQFGNDMKKYLKRSTSSFKFKAVSSADVLDCVMSISSNKATGLDQIPAGIIKDTMDAILTPLLHIMNLSLTTGKVPQQWKIGRVTPLHKGGSLTDPSNYRPICVLPVLSKVLEKLVFKQVYAYLTDNNLLTKCQHGFRPKHSTSTALINVVEDFQVSIDNGEVVAVVTLDLEKAFDLMPQDILIEKLKYLGFDDLAIEWFRQYFKLRKQVTTVNGNSSPVTLIESGVPQGSILGPLLFILMLNDLPEVVKQCKVSLYADDTCLYFSAKDPNILESIINTELSSLSDWFFHNHLLLNVKKCNFMLIGTKAKLRHFDSVKININGTRLGRVTECKYLGVTLDENLSWKAHINQVRNKSLGSLYLLKRSRSFIDEKTALLLYKTIIQSHFDYCSITWMNGNLCDLQRLQTLQNRALRVVLGVDAQYNREALYNTLKIDRLNERWKKQAVTQIHKAIYNLLPESLCSRIALREKYYNVRNNDTIVSLPKPRTNILKRSPFYSASKLFNKLPQNIRIIDNIRSFTKAIQKVNFNIL